MDTYEIITILRKEGLRFIFDENIFLKSGDINLERMTLDHPVLETVSAADEKALRIQLSMHACEILDSTLTNSSDSLEAVQYIFAQKDSYLLEGKPIKMGKYDISDINMVRQKARDDGTIAELLEKEMMEPVR